MLPNFGERILPEDPRISPGKRLRKLERIVAKKVNASKATSCRRYGNHGDQKVLGNKCRRQLQTLDSRQQTLVLYNPVNYERAWCAIKVPPKGTIRITNSDDTESCTEPPRLFEWKPTVVGAGMPEIHVGAGMLYSSDFPDPGSRFKCDIPCRKSGYEGDVLKIYKVKGTDWKIIYSMESSQHYPELMSDESAWRNDKYFATTSFRSEIPLPYFSWAEYNITTPAIQYDGAIRGASFVARNCESANNREQVVKDLMNKTRVDAISECLRNAEPPPVVDVGGLQGKIALMRAYLFHLAFENSKEDDYITEKLWGTLQAGTLPIYYGAPNVKEHAPPNSIISWHDFPSTEELAEYMNKVAANKTLYDSYHEWRSKPLAESFRRKFDFTHTHSVCRMCRWSYAKKYGFGWDHVSQTVQDLVVSRDIKYGADGKVTHPFQESWLTPGKGAGFSRTVWDHDGVIDLHFEALPQSNKEVYRMKTAVRGHFRANASNSTVFVLQNDSSRVTVLTSWNAEVMFPEPGSLDITLEPSFDFSRVRVILEDVDTFHVGADKEPNYFGDFMARDFFTPMEAFLVEGASTFATL